MINNRITLVLNDGPECMVRFTKSFPDGKVLALESPAFDAENAKDVLHYSNLTFLCKRLIDGVFSHGFYSNNAENYTSFIPLYIEVRELGVSHLFPAGWLRSVPISFIRGLFLDFMKTKDSVVHNDTNDVNAVLKYIGQVNPLPGVLEDKIYDLCYYQPTGKLNYGYTAPEHLLHYCYNAMTYPFIINMLPRQPGGDSCATWLLSETLRYRYIELSFALNGNTLELNLLGNFKSTTDKSYVGTIEAFSLESLLDYTNVRADLPSVNSAKLTIDSMLNDYDIQTQIVLT